MAEAVELSRYLPLSFKTESEQEYIKFLWESFETNYTHEKYHFAFLAYHMLTMSCVYFNIWQIKQTAPEDFEKAMIGFSRETEKELLGASSPFTFWRVSESVVLRFLKLIGCDNAKIGAYAALVKDRNNTAHSNGNIFCSEQGSLDLKIQEVLRVVDEIQNHSKTIIERCYKKFLIESSDPEEREYDNNEDQIREILIHPNYFSQNDIKFCLNFNIASLSEHKNYTMIQNLHNDLIVIYKPDDE